MRGVFDVAAGRVLSGLGDRLANRRLHFVGIGLRQDAVEIQIHGWLIDAIKTLQVSESEQPVVAKAIGLIASCADALTAANAKHIAVRVTAARDGVRWWNCRKGNRKWFISSLLNPLILRGGFYGLLTANDFVVRFCVLPPSVRRCHDREHRLV